MPPANVEPVMRKRAGSCATSVGRRAAINVVEICIFAVIRSLISAGLCELKILKSQSGDPLVPPTLLASTVKSTSLTLSSESSTALSSPRVTSALKSLCSRPLGSFCNLSPQLFSFLALRSCRTTLEPRIPAQ